MTPTDPTRRLENLRVRGAELGKRLAALEVELAEAADTDADDLLHTLIREREALAEKIAATSRGIAAAQAALSDEARERRRNEIENVETLAVAALTADAEDAARVECLLNDLADVLRGMHARGANLRAAVHPLLQRGPEGVRFDGAILDDLDHRSGTLGRLIQSEMVRRGLFRDLAPTVDAWPRRPADTTLSAHFNGRADRQGRRVARVIADALQGV